MENWPRVPPHDATTWLWSFREDVLIENDGAELVVATRWGDHRVDDPGGTLGEPLRRMTLGPVSVTNTLGSVALPSRAGDRFRQVVDMLVSSVVFSVGVGDGMGPLLSAVPITRVADLDIVPVDADRPVRLSRFGALRVVENELLLESPRAHHRVVLHREPSARVVVSLCRAVTPRRLADELSVALPVVAEIVTLLAATGMVLVGGPDCPDGSPFAEDDVHFGPWTHHDLLFHSRTRLGHHDDPLGGAAGDPGGTPAPLVTKPVPRGVRTRLYRPDLDVLAATDRTLTDVLESPQRPGPTGRPPTVEQLGELLFRAARIRSIGQRDLTRGGYVVSDRPYPTSGGSYDLELYVLATNCVGLAVGAYHYDPLDHALTAMTTDPEELANLLATVEVHSGLRGQLPVTIIMTTRIGRISWIYQGIAYATALRHVGILQQTLSLVATAMGLVSLIVPVGDSMAVRRAIHLDWPDEVNVGEIVVGA